MLPGQLEGLIEDAAHSFLSTKCGRHAATFGADSFDCQKNITGGQAGALVSNGARLMSRGKILRARGTDRSAFLRSEAAAYSWQDLGSSFAPAEIAATTLLAQFEHADDIPRARRALWTHYHEGFHRPSTPAWCAARRSPTGAARDRPLFVALHKLIPCNNRYLAIYHRERFRCR
jgi:dTDP-4-amino-4,6-dideoxygalactose transaminase